MISAAQAVSRHLATRQREIPVRAAVGQNPRLASGVSKNHQRLTEDRPAKRFFSKLF